MILWLHLWQTTPQYTGPSWVSRHLEQRRITQKSNKINIGANQCVQQVKQTNLLQYLQTVVPKVMNRLGTAKCD